jgi:MFS family permease
MAALWLYIDRVCFSTLAPPITAELVVPDAPEPTDEDTLSSEQVETAKKKKREADPSLGENVDLTPDEIVALKKKKWADARMSYVLGAFFLTYALFQIPIGALADRYGARVVLTASFAAWSLVTAATGLAESFAVLLAVRLLLGITESGAYPAAAGLVKRWARPEERGRFSSVVALGGRIGGFIAPLLTAWLAVSLVGVGPSSWQNSTDQNWRGVLVIYGVCGLAVAGLFYLVVRDHPPGAAPSPTSPAASSAPTFTRSLALLCRSRNMWFFGSLQFGVNLGWAFLVTLFPIYLKEVFDLPPKQIGLMQTVVLGIGCIGMISGGVVTDMLRRRLGPRLGRSVPIAVALGGCAVALFFVPILPSVWLVVIVLGMMAFLVDMHNPSIWSFAQDVGGKNVGAALGFGNMWGNLGAALSPVLLMAVKNAAGWDVVFLVGGTAFAIAACCGLLLDATKPVDDHS